jgi:anti-sigma regulatory factor (Ser/Thr protein kinase)
MSELLWTRRPPPRPASGAVPLLRAAPATTAELTALRMRLHTALRDDGRPAGVDEGAVDRLLLVFEELASNGLRHGRGPVEVSVVDLGTGWLLEVVDSDPGHAPSPAVGRDPARGGLGLVLVARLSGSHGWTVDGGGRKKVWACVEYTAPTAGWSRSVWRTLPAARPPARSEEIR